MEQKILTEANKTASHKIVDICLGFHTVRHEF